MAEEKTIVTKKTAPKAGETLKKTVTRKTAAKPPTSEPPATASAPASASQAPSKAGPVTKPAPIRKAPATGPAPIVTKPTSATTTSAATRARKATPKPAEAPAPTPPAAVKGRTTRQSSSLQTLANTSDEERLHMIQEAAYYRAEKRSFAPGHEVEDWAEAEREIDDLIANAKRISGR